MPDHHHPAEEHPIDLYIIHNDKPLTVFDEWPDDAYDPDPLDLDDPGDEGTILDVLRALHDRRPDLYHAGELIDCCERCDDIDVNVLRLYSPGDGQ